MKQFTNCSRWLKLRKIILANEPICRQCKQALANEVHHIKDRETHPDLSFIASNLEPLCKSCHSSITATREAARNALVGKEQRCKSIAKQIEEAERNEQCKTTSAGERLS